MPEKILIGSDHLCTCSVGDACPLGRRGSQARCSVTELVEHGVEIERIEVLPPQRPTYNHTREDSPLTPCEICASLVKVMNAPETQPTPAPEPTEDQEVALGLKGLCKQIVGELEIDAIAIAVVTPEGRVGVTALSIAEHADRITKEMHRALLAIAGGDEVVCIGCGGKKTINGYACLGCGGRGVMPKKEG